MGKNISLKSIVDFKNDNINFYIPSYQRGYRWKSRQVCQLIDDINAFTPTESTPFYFLQALAVAKDIEKDRVNVVDGQQRLTTLNLILDDESSKLPIDYAREANNALDQHFRDMANNVIEEKLGETTERRTEFCKKIKECCRFLYYEVDKDKELSTFYQLNSGKIPAKDSELVKCVMLTLGNDESSDITNARANEWDEIERKLNDNSFFSFCTPRDTWRKDDRMTVLLRYAGLTPTPQEQREEVFPFLTRILDELKTKSRITIWKMIYSALYRLLEWYNDPLMYHAFGAIVHQRNNKDIKPKTRKEILGAIENMAKYEHQEDKDAYSNWGEDLFNYLLLSNVAFCWKRWPYRYSFEMHRKVDAWSIEHIFARNQKDLDEKELAEWLGEDDSESAFNEYRTECDKGKGDDWLSKKIGSRYPSTEDNSVKNLALLPKNANSSLNNKLFEGKREAVSKWACDSWADYWAPPVTEAVFMKSLPGLKMTLPYWSEEDKDSYIKSMSMNIASFIDALKNPVRL
ncbi:DUF262 domain-containing protein [uncultured Prevotella sp.]|uniref:DUF262 domain-containing protein n=1 Tax=uncultured Prevotella sp. TaxID=159272 RepID=UPI002606C62C|nr:DUF262 domain-containing protein [uncultured Prevotella sp.]